VGEKREEWGRHRKGPAISLRTRTAKEKNKQREVRGGIFSGSEDGLTHVKDEFAGARLFSKRKAEIRGDNRLRTSSKENQNGKCSPP